MCDLFGNSNDSSAADARQAELIQQQEAVRANAIAQDTKEIDSAFAPFNDAYYKSYENAYTTANNQQLDFQYGRAKGNLEAGLADNDQLDSSTGATRMGDLDQTYRGARASIGNSAVDNANQLRAGVSNSESNLYGLAQQATNPLTIASQAQAQAGSIVAPQAYPTLGNVFSDAMGPVASYAKAGSQGYPGGGSGGVNNYAPLGGSGGAFS